MSIRRRQPPGVHLKPVPRRSRPLPKMLTLVERERALDDNAVDKVRLDWLSQVDDTGTSNLYALWQCMLSHAPGDLREVIDYLRSRKRERK